MRITVLSVPDCPHAPVARQRITEALDGRTATIEMVEVTTPEQAEQLGMTGSPTVLVDGTDPFAVPGAEPSLSCRLYRDETGMADGAPDRRALRRALIGDLPSD